VQKSEKKLCKYRTIFFILHDIEQKDNYLKEGMKMKKPVLVIMAAGMGSRYGGLKQIDPIDAQGHIIIDFSIYDAIKAGFEKVIFIIKKGKMKRLLKR